MPEEYDAEQLRCHELAVMVREIDVQIDDTNKVMKDYIFLANKAIEIHVSEVAVDALEQMVVQLVDHIDKLKMIRGKVEQAGHDCAYNLNFSG